MNMMSALNNMNPMQLLKMLGVTDVDQMIMKAVSTIVVTLIKEYPDDKAELYIEDPKESEKMVVIEKLITKSTPVLLKKIKKDDIENIFQIIQKNSKP